MAEPTSRHGAASAERGARDVDTPFPESVEIAPSILYIGTPVCLISSLNEDGSTNLAPMSSCWALGEVLVLGLGVAGKTFANLNRVPECVVNFPDERLWDSVERMAPLTGQNPVPDPKADRYRFEPDKFGAAGLTPCASTRVRPMRVAECPLQMEARVAAVHPPASDDGFAIVEVEVTQVHAHPRIVVPGTSYIDTELWRPLLYVFRHYFSTGPRLGKTFKAEY